MNAQQPAVSLKWILGASLLVPALVFAQQAAPSGKNLVGDETVVASLNPPAANASCGDAAAQTSVYFNFAHPQFQVTQISLYVDGAGVPSGSVDEHWPTVTLKSGLHTGMNTIDVVANGSGGQTMDRRLRVQIGAAASADASAVVVACNDSTATAQLAPSAADGEADQSSVAEAPPPAEVQAPPVAEAAPVYDDGADSAAYADGGPDYYDGYPGPVYVYNAYPVVALDPWVPFIPFYSFGFFYSSFHPYCPPPVFAYHDRWYGHGGWHGGGGWHSGGGWHGGGPGWHGGGVAGGSGFHGGPVHGGPVPRGGFAQRPGFASQNYAPRGGIAGATSRPGFAAGSGPRSQFGGRGFPNAATRAPGASYTRGFAGRGTFNGYAGPQSHYMGSPGGMHANMSAAPRPAANWGGGGFRSSSAPAFHGGGSFGGSFHGGGGSGGFHGAGSGGFHGGGAGGHHR